MKNDYMFKRIFIGVAIGVILMLIRGCKVNAEQLTPSLIYSYNGTSNSSYTGSNLNTQTINTLTYVGPIIPANRNFDSVRFRYQNVTFATNDNLRQLSFVGQSDVGIPAVYVQNGTRIYGCYVNAELDNDTSGTNNDTLIVGTAFNVICPNVILSGTDISIWYKYSSMNFLSSNSGILISKQMSITVMTNNSEVVNAITSQQQQQHSDNQVINESINDVNNTINDTTQDISSNFNSNTSTGFWNNYGSTGVTELWAIPINIFSRIRNRLLYADNNVQLTIDETDLPMSSKINYGGDFVLPPLRNFINNIIGSTWYEFIGGLVGSILLVKVLISKGKGALKLWTLKDTQKEIWGGIE